MTGTSEPEKQVKTSTTGGGPSGPATLSYSATQTTTVKTNSVAPPGGSRPASVAANLSSTINVAPTVAVSSSVAAGGGTAASAVGGGLEQQQQSQAAVASIQQTSAVAVNAMADSKFADELQHQSVESSAVTGVGRQPSGGDPGPAGQRSGQKSGGGPSNGLASYSNHPSHSLPTQQNISSLTQVSYTYKAIEHVCRRFSPNYRTIVNILKSNYHIFK